MGVFLSILQGVLLIILAIVAFFIAQIVYGMGQGMLYEWRRDNVPVKWF